MVSIGSSSVAEPPDPPGSEGPSPLDEDPADVLKATEATAEKVTNSSEEKISRQLPLSGTESAELHPKGRGKPSARELRLSETGGNGLSVLSSEKALANAGERPAVGSRTPSSTVAECRSGREIHAGGLDECAPKAVPLEEEGLLNSRVADPPSANVNVDVEATKKFCGAGHRLNGIVEENKTASAAGMRQTIESAGSQESQGPVSARASSSPDSIDTEILTRGPPANGRAEVVDGSEETSCAQGDRTDAPRKSSSHVFEPKEQDSSPDLSSGVKLQDEKGRTDETIGSSTSVHSGGDIVDTQIDDEQPAQRTPETEAAESVVRSAIDGVVESYKRGRNTATQSIGNPSSVNKAAIQRELYNLVKSMSPERSEGQSSADSQNPGVPFGDYRNRIIGRVLWTQTIDSLTISICVPSSVRAKDMSINIFPQKIYASVKNAEDALIDGKLSGTISTDGCVWALESRADARVLTLELEKQYPKWWFKLFESDSADDYKVTSSGTPPSYPQSKTGTAVVSGRAQVPTKSSSSPSPVGPSEAPIRYSLAKDNMEALAKELKKKVEEDAPDSRESASQLAEIYYRGIGVKVNFADAARFYKFALIKSGVQDDHAAYQLGHIYNQGGHGVTEDAEEAFRWWRIAASMGHNTAIHNLGVLHLQGRGTDLNPEAAERYFRKAKTLTPDLRQKVTDLKNKIEMHKATTNRILMERIKQERARRREAGIQTMKYTLYGTAALIGISLTVTALIHWWRNRL